MILTQKLSMVAFGLYDSMYAMVYPHVPNSL